MALRFYNTLTQQVEPFTPLHDNTVRMYTCGPTVYNFVHIGNLRTFTFQDILRRWLRARGFKLDHVMNITDVEDKIIRNAAAEHKSLAEYTEKYTQAFLEDSAALRLERPERMVKATEHITEMVEAIEKLDQARLHLSERRFGLLSHLEISRIRQTLAQRLQRHPRRRARGWDEYDKADARDFVLWKAPKDDEPFWDSAIGPGPAGLAHRVLRDGHEVSGRDAGHPRRRRRPDLSASRKRNRAVGSDHLETLRALLAAFGIPERRNAEDVEVGRELLYAARSAGEWATRRKWCAICWRRFRIARS